MNKVIKVVPSYFCGGVYLLEQHPLCFWSHYYFVLWGQNLCLHNLSVRLPAACSFLCVFTICLWDYLQLAHFLLYFILQTTVVTFKMEKKKVSDSWKFQVNIFVLKILELNFWTSKEVSPHYHVTAIVWSTENYDCSFKHTLGIIWRKTFTEIYFMLELYFFVSFLI